MKIIFRLLVLGLMVVATISCDSTGGTRSSYQINYSHGMGYPHYYPRGGYGPPIYRPRPPVYRPRPPIHRPPSVQPMPRARAR